MMVPGRAERCDILLPTCGQGGLVKECLESLIRHTKYPYRVIVVDDGAPAEVAKIIDDYAKSGRLDMIIVRPGERLGWIRAVNAGLERSKDSKYVCIQNDDTVFTEGWLEELVKLFELDPKIGIANPEWDIPEGADIDAYAARLKKYAGTAIDTDYCRGHSFFVRREVVDKLGGFDTAYLPAYYDDRDYSLKAIAGGYRCVRAKGAFVYHVRNATFSKAVERAKVLQMMERNGRIFYARWGTPLRIIFVLEETAGAGRLLQEICMDQNKVVVITRTGRSVPYEHTNLTVVRFGPWLLNFAALGYLAARRSRKKQKGIDFVFTDSEKFASCAKFLKGLVMADVVCAAGIALLRDKARALVQEKKSRDKGVAS